MNKQILTVIAFSTLAMSSYAGVTKDKIKETVFKNINCAATDSCDLVEFRVQSYDYHVTFADQSPSHGTSAFMSYTTKNIDDLENYALVQQIRGCIFNSVQNYSGEVIKSSNYVRDFFNESVAYKHIDWQIDSIDLDSMYNNGNANFRHAPYRWNTVKKSFAKDTEKIYAKERPTTPTLYVSDLPGTAFADYGEAKNISLEFKTCIYKTGKIPLVATPGDVNFSEPIACLPWKSSMIYNHESKKFESKNEIDSFCTQKDDSV
jgi:hypothetical protein